MNAPLLRQLLDRRGAFVPLMELGPDHDATWRDLDEIAGFGFTIERHPLLGVACLAPAERLCPDQIEHELNTKLIGRRVSVWNRVASTNDLAARAAGSAANEGLVVLAEEQTAGRGRRGRSWASPAGSSLLMSVLLFPEGPAAEPAWLTAIASLAVAEVVSEWSGRLARIKWPNDVRVDRKKVAGILVERGAGAVVGIGLNVNLAPESFPDEIRETATSISALLGSVVDRSELARALIRSLDVWYETSRGLGAETIGISWRERAESLGEEVVVDTPDGPCQGRLIDLDPVRGLVLIDGEGTRTPIPSHRVQAIVPAR